MIGKTNINGGSISIGSVVYERLPQGGYIPCNGRYIESADSSYLTALIDDVLTPSGFSYGSFTELSDIFGTAITSLGYGNGYFVAADESGVIKTSRNGTTWTAVNNPTSGGDSLNVICYGNGVFVGVCDNCIMIKSTNNGQTWTVTTTLSSSYAITNIAYHNGIFVAVGDGGVVFTSYDSGSTWTVQSSITGTPNITGIAYGYNDMFIITTDTNKIFRSYDYGSTWTQTATISSISSGNLIGLCYGKGVFVAIANNEYATFSYDGVSWTNITVDDNSGRNYLITYNNGLYIINYGLGGVKRSTTGKSWATYVANTYTTSNIDTAVTYGNGLLICGDKRGFLKYSTVTPTQTQIPSYQSNAYIIEQL